MFKRVLLCYDGSAAGRRALRSGAELAISLQSQIHVLCILSKATEDATRVASSIGQVCLLDYELEYRQSLDEALGWLNTRGVRASGHLARGNTLDEIVAHTNRLKIDLIVVGHYPKPTGGRWWSGPERASLAERVNCCVMIAMSEVVSAATA